VPRSPRRRGLALALEAAPAARFSESPQAAALTRELPLAPCAAVAFLPVGRGRAIAGAAFAMGLIATLPPVVGAIIGLRRGSSHVAGQAELYTGNNRESCGVRLAALVRGNPHFGEADRAAAEERSDGRSAGASLRVLVRAGWHMRAAALRRPHDAPQTRAFWNDFEISDNQDSISRAASWSPAPLSGWLIAPLASRAAGVSAGPRCALLAGFVVVCLAVVAFFSSRAYRIQVVPALLPLAALGPSGSPRVRAGGWKQLAVACTVVVAEPGSPSIRSASSPATTRSRSTCSSRTSGTSTPPRAIPTGRSRCSRTPSAAARCPSALGEPSTRSWYGRLAEGQAYFAAFARDHPQHPTRQATSRGSASALSPGLAFRAARA
jgi:hypothetical protein